MTEEELFNAALAKPRDERGPFLDQACAGNAPLRTAVEALLAAHEAPGSFLNPPDPNSTILDPDQTLDSAGEAEDAAATGERTPHRCGDRDSGTAQVATTDHHRDGTPGVVIAGRFTLQEKIGEGGMGEVWVAKQTEPVKRKVALKLIKPGMDSRAVIQRFEQERQALAMMDHPSIARVLDGGMTPSGQPFFVMELVNGLPLNKFCDQAKLTPKERLELFVPICQAVQHAHTKGIVHRDLKPANILVTMVDGRPVPKVIDFGVAKATSGKLTEETMSTGFGAVVGTLEYMSPEQAGFSNADIDTRADIYSLGVVLYELLTGLRPIDAQRMKQAAIAEMIRIIQEEEPSKPSTRLSTNDSLPSLAAMRHIEPKKLMALLRGDLDWIVMKCLEKQRDRRYETANALARDIQRYLADESVEARSPSTGYRLKKFIRRNQVIVISGSAVAAALLLGLIGFAWQAQVARDQRDLVIQAQTEILSQSEQIQEAKIRVEDSRDAFRGLAFDILDSAEQRLKSTPGVEAFRNQVMERSFDTFLQLHEKEPSDVRVEKSLAQSARLSANQKARTNDPHGAVERIQLSIDLQTRGLVAADDAFAAHVYLAETYRDLANIHRKNAQLIAAADALSSASELLDGLEETEETRIRLKRVSASVALAQIGGYNELFQLDEALDAATRSVDQYRAVLESDEGTTLDSITTALAIAWKGKILDGLERHEEARSIFAAGIEQARKNQLKKPTDRNFLYVLSRLLHWDADGQSRSGISSAELTAQVDEAVEMCGKLHAAYELSEGFQYNYGDALRTHGRIKAAENDAEATAASFDQAVLVLQSLTEKSPLPDYLGILATTLGDRAEFAVSQDNKPAAVADLQTALALTERCVREAPDSVRQTQLQSKLSAQLKDLTTSQ